MRSPLKELARRGMVLDNSFKDSSPEKWVVYAGFDPTAPSLHVGNLMTLMGLWHFSWTGHKTFALIGGATGGIGDPSGKSAERNLIDETVVSSNTVSLREQLKTLNTNANNYAIARSKSASTVQILDNRDWFRDMRMLDFLRDTGRNFRLGNMLAKESVKSRLNTTSGMSFTEFSYQILQAYDFYHLYKTYGCNLQIGGSDQWGNILAGCDLIAKKLQWTSSKVGGLTLPLVTTSDGIKFGKSEGNAIWLDSKMTSVFDFYQVRIAG
jgi:tyrosyl-tRNA synthetase